MIFRNMVALAVSVKIAWKPESHWPFEVGWLQRVPPSLERAMFMLSAITLASSVFQFLHPTGKSWPKVWSSVMDFSFFVRIFLAYQKVHQGWIFEYGLSLDCAWKLLGVKWVFKLKPAKTAPIRGPDHSKWNPGRGRNPRRFWLALMVTSITIVAFWDGLSFHYYVWKALHAALMAWSLPHIAQSPGN